MLPTLKGARSCADTMSRPPTCSATCRRNSACRPTIPLRAVRALTDEALQTMSRRFASLYATTGRPLIPPEQWLRALLLQVLYTVRSERLLMEELNDNLLFRWFVGLKIDDPVWHPTTFTKNRDRLLSGDVAAAFFDAVQAHARAAGLLSDEHFTVDGTQLEAWASRGSAIDGRTTRHAGYHVSQRKRKLVEQVFGWMKTVGGLRKLRHRGIALVDWQLTFAATAYNLVRLRNLEARCP